jgi:hypothetical protein
MNYRRYKKINFFGDSWFWNWYGPGLYDYRCESNTMKMRDFYNEGNSQSLSALKFYCHALGYGATVYNHPGYTFYQTVESILKVNPTKETLVNVVFFSNVLRVTTYKSFPIHDYNGTLNKIKLDTINLLKQINEWAEQHNTYVLLIGGQSQLPKEFYEASNCGKYVMLLSECLLADIASLLHKKDIEPFGIFRVACFIDKMDKTWHKDLVDIIWYQTKKIFDNQDIKLVTFPDFSHLNPLSSMVLLDMIFKKIEKLQLDK